MDYSYTIEIESWSVWIKKFSLIGADEKTIRDYIRRQEKEDYSLDQMEIFEE